MVENSNLLLFEGNVKNYKRHGPFVAFNILLQNHIIRYKLYLYIA